ncbi:uncharacterized protein LOC143022246 [Oratosquilla oratoria]|uniref:uncharacterized protein LOC143022246 n=1 Tax=Oratosquilla oratoria TaxID=337810 RepID=UPI003F7644D0
MGPRLEDFDIVGTIGRGAHGTVRKVRRKSDGRVMVWKELDYGAMNEAEKQGLVLEVNLLRELHHPNIVRFIHHMIHKRTTTLYILMEYCPGGDLKYLISKCKHTGTFLEEGFIWRILKQVCEALHACHSRQLRGGRLILHRDIKPANIFLDSDGNVKLGDFGLARTLSSDASFATTCVGTPFYMSPEVVDGREYNEKSDIWSLGCLIYELCALHPPFQGASQKDLAAKIKRVRYENIPVHYSSDMQAVIDFMLVHEDFLRPTAFMILHYPALVQHTRTKEEIDEELLTLSINPSLPKASSSVPKVTTQAEINSSGPSSCVEGQDKLEKDAEGIEFNSVNQTDSDEQKKTEVKAVCISSPSCENDKEKKGVGSNSLNTDLMDGKEIEREEQKADKKKMESSPKISGQDNLECFSERQESHSKGSDSSSFVKTLTESKRAEISGVNIKQASTNSETLAKTTVKVHSYSDNKINNAVHSSSGTNEKQKQLVSPCTNSQTFVSSPLVPKEQAVLDVKVDDPNTWEGEGRSGGRSQESSHGESIRKSKSVPSSPKKAHRDSLSLKPFNELSGTRSPHACRKLVESMSKQDCFCGGAAGEEWRVRLANLREAEVNVRMRELAVEERERELARREKKIVSMEREAREHLVRAQIYLRQARPRNSGAGIGVTPTRPPSDLDTTMSADPGDVFPSTIAKLDPTRISNPFLRLRGISPPSEKHVSFVPKMAVPFKSNTLDNPKSRRKSENVFSLVERMAELNLDSEVTKIPTPVAVGNNLHGRPQIHSRARKGSTSSLDQENVESLNLLCKQTNRGSEPALSHQQFPDNKSNYCIAKKKTQKITDMVGLPNTSKPKIKSAMPWTRRPGTDLRNIGGGLPKKKQPLPKQALHCMKSPALDKENVGSPSRKGKRPERTQSLRQRFLHRIGNGKKATGQVPCVKIEEPQSVAVGNNKVLHFYNVM